MAKPHEIDYETFRENLVLALRKAWQEIRSRRPRETFFLFGIETDSDITDLQPLCNTEEQYLADGGEAEPTAAKWFMDDDATLYRAGHKHTAALAREVNRYVFEDHTLHSETAFRKRKRALLEVFEQALVQLDRERFFGTGRNRNRALLQVAFVDPDAAEWRHMLKVIKRINPAACTAAFFKALKKVKRQDTDDSEWM
jgi:hypothetical protein